ncbi:hypothetical protein AgCh_027856 [Apium graveolens]
MTYAASTDHYYHVQLGYSQPPPSQAGYAQPDSGGQRVAAAGYSVARASCYGPPPYDAPPVTQSGYGQPSPAYSADTNAAPASQSYNPSGGAKTSPQK